MAAMMTLHQLGPCVLPVEPFCCPVGFHALLEQTPMVEMSHGRNLKAASGQQPASNGGIAFNGLQGIECDQPTL